MNLFSKRDYDYKELARKFSFVLSKNVSPDEFYLNVLKFFTEVVGAEGGALVLKDKERYAVRQCLGWKNFSFQMEEVSSLIHWLKKNRGTLVRSQLLENPHFAPIKAQGLHFFIQFQAEVLLPLFSGEDLLGFMTLAAKKKGRPYRLSCLLVLDWLGCQFSLALQNALLREEIRLQNLELDAVKDLKTQIVANLSHELRTPLTGVIGFTELLAEEIDGPLNDAQKKHVGEVLEGSNRLLKILSALVEMAKLEAGSLSLHVQQFPLAPLVQSLSDEISLSTDTSLRIRLNHATPQVYGDLNLVRQIFKHLLDNAAKYTPKGEVLVTADKIGEMLEVCVADTGIGISEEKLSHIFDGFYQANGGLTRDFQGPGIGLTLSKKLVELHGGRLWVKSHVGRGSRFYFTLPLKPIAIKHRELAA